MLSKQIKTIKKGEYCSRCKEEKHLYYHAYCKECYQEYNQQYINKTYDGMYLYQIANRVTGQTIYLGSTSNIYRRYQQHFNTKKGSPFSKWCTYNKIDKNNYKMQVLDLTRYDTIDVDELLTLEHELIYTHRDRLINKQMLEPLNLYEIDTLERIYSEIDIHHLEWISYKKLFNRKKNTYQDSNLDKQIQKNGLNNIK